MLRKVIATYYDGTNSDDVWAAAQLIDTTATWTRISGGDPLYVTRQQPYGGPLYYYTVGYDRWLVVLPDSGLWTVLTDEAYQRGYRNDPGGAADLTTLSGTVDALSATVTALADVTAGKAQAFGLGFVPALALNAQTTIQVHITPSYAGGYTPDVEIVGTAALLAGLSVLSATVVSAVRVDVVVKNTGLLTFGGTNLIVRVP